MTSKMMAIIGCLLPVFAGEFRGCRVQGQAVFPMESAGGPAPRTPRDIFAKKKQGVVLSLPGNTRLQGR